VTASRVADRDPPPRRPSKAHCSSPSTDPILKPIARKALPVSFEQGAALVPPLREKAACRAARLHERYGLPWEQWGCVKSCTPTQQPQNDPGSLLANSVSKDDSSHDWKNVLARKPDLGIRLGAWCSQLRRWSTTGKTRSRGFLQGGEVHQLVSVIAREFLKKGTILVLYWRALSWIAPASAGEDSFRDRTKGEFNSCRHPIARPPAYCISSNSAVAPPHYLDLGRHARGLNESAML